MDTMGTLIALENERCRAISECDWPGLEALLADDFTYGFLSARIEDKKTYLAGIPSRPHRVERGDLSVRVYNNAAVMTGDFVTSDIDTGETLNAGTGLQTWIKGDNGEWLLVAMSTTRFGPRSTHWSNPPAAKG